MVLHISAVKCGVVCSPRWSEIHAVLLRSLAFQNASLGFLWRLSSMLKLGREQKTRRCDVFHSERCPCHLLMSHSLSSTGQVCETEGFAPGASVKFTTVDSLG